jgi:hypothetical protein
MLFVAVMATLCGAKSCVDITDFCAANEANTAEIVDLPHGAPSRDCFSRLFRSPDPDEMASAFMAFAKAVREPLGLGQPSGVTAVDGKRLKHGYKRGRAFMPPLMVSVWDAQTRLSLGALASADGDEIKATLKALKSLDLRGGVVTADALHSHAKMAEAIRAQGGHCALKLRANNGPLHACAASAFTPADANRGAAFCETSQSGHDRFERRRVSVVAARKDAPNLPRLVMLGRIESERRKAGGKVKTGFITPRGRSASTPRQLMAILR